MNNSVKIGLIFGLAWSILKYISFLIYPMQVSIMPAVMLNILFLLSAIAVSLYITKRKQTEAESFLGDIKNGLKAGIPYTVLVAVFIFIYYNNINPGYNERQIKNAEAKIEEIFNDPKEYKAFKESNPSFEVMTKEELREQSLKGPVSFYTPGATMTLSLLALLLLSTLYSILVSIVFRRIVFRD
jgi:hypothetical protein